MPIDDPPTFSDQPSTNDNQQQMQPGNSGAVVPGGQENNRVDAVTVRQSLLPPFNKQNPRLWFAQVEFSFANNNITSDTSKFRYVAIQLTGEVLNSVSDLILNPPTQNKYDTLKKRIVGTYDEGDETRLRRLLRGHEIGQERPTAYLHHLRNLAGKECTDVVFRTLFLEQLPEQVRAILAISDVADLQRLAEMADKAVDVIKPTLAVVTKQKEVVSKADAQEQSTINSLEAKIEALSKKLNKVLRHQSRSRSRGRFSRARSPRPTSTDQADLCYYHKRFGSNARKCQAPCSKASQIQNSEN